MDYSPNRRYGRIQQSLEATVYCDGTTPMRIEIDQENDGRWIAEVSDLEGVLAYGENREQAVAKVESLALRVIADRLDHGESIPELDDLFAFSR
jgi:predicted RNase H-like HicB family nuclease